MSNIKDDSFELFDLNVEVVGDPAEFVCSHNIKDSFRVEGENLVFGETKISMYALAALIPLLPAKQRKTDRNDWMTTDAEIACPDPHCHARFKITRTKLRTFQHHQVTKVPLV